MGARRRSESSDGGLFDGALSSQGIVQWERDHDSQQSTWVISLLAGVCSNSPDRTSSDSAETLQMPGAEMIQTRDDTSCRAWLAVRSVATGTFVMVTSEFMPIGLVSAIARDLQGSFL
jgi:hypothetical protein